jgi:hypothetical protein
LESDGCKSSGIGSALRELSDIHGCDANRQTGTEGAGGARCVAHEGDDEAGKVRAIEHVADGDQV